MSDPIDDLKNKWNKAKTSEPDQASTSHLIELSKKKMRGAVKMHIGNIAVLTITLIGISAFFVYVAPLKETLSHFGIALMTGGLLIRIVIECYSIYRSSKVDFSETAIAASKKTMNFYSYRKRIHGPVTIGILIAYTVGFYVLTPEFTDYLTTTQVILMDTSYLLAAAIFGFSIRKAIKDEMRILDELKGLQEEIVEA
ncbi:hypothetical protein AAOE16_03560 [Ekhidna sp. MALMAid0563]|uniref:hypothetical protein n=1 Tax=Ekhidna sp. MALMAid0563 TaxID=3143937 RepID=UPI0032DF92A5